MFSNFTKLINGSNRLQAGGGRAKYHDQVNFCRFKVQKSNFCETENERILTDIFGYFKENRLYLVTNQSFWYQHEVRRRHNYISSVYY